MRFYTLVRRRGFWALVYLMPVTVVRARPSFFYPYKWGNGLRKEEITSWPRSQSCQYWSWSESKSVQNLPFYLFPESWVGYYGLGRESSHVISRYVQDRPNLSNQSVEISLINSSHLEGLGIIVPFMRIQFYYIQIHSQNSSSFCVEEGFPNLPSL